jgi:UDP-N-acetylmuramyl pentapeptide phosphotransferase/UDP-N-acetylglucosamine-1-phosphate transferase
MIAGVVAGAWLVAWVLAIDDPGSLLDFLIPFVGMLIFGAIAWPDDFRRNPPTKRDGPPEA